VRSKILRDEKIQDLGQTVLRKREYQVNEERRAAMKTRTNVKAGYRIQ